MRAFLLFASLLALSLANLAPAPPVEVHFYAMSKCPYASLLVAQFQEYTMSVAGISTITNVTIDYIAQVDPSSPSGFSSKHGPDEGTAFRTPF
jgi:hypothetical protein